MSWVMAPPNSAPPPSATEAPVVNGGGGAVSDASFGTNMLIIVVALLFALVLALGLNSLVLCALRWGPRAAGGGGEEEASGAAGGVKNSSLRSIPVEVYGGGGEGDVCAICLAEFADGEKVRVLPRCGHGFHVGCVDSWLVLRGSCATCRGSVMDVVAVRGGGGGGGGGSRRPESDTVAVVIT